MSNQIFPRIYILQLAFLWRKIFSTISFNSLFNPCDILAHGNRHRQIDFRYQCLDKLTCEFGSRQLKKCDRYRDAVSYFNQFSIIKLTIKRQNMQHYDLIIHLDIGRSNIWYIILKKDNTTLHPWKEITLTVCSIIYRE